MTQTGTPLRHSWFHLLLIACLAARSASAHADSDDAQFSAMLMREGIEAYSEAGARGDQAAADALLDDDVLFSGGDGTVQRDDKRDKADAVSLALKKQTETMRQAGLRGDRAAMSVFFDTALLAVDEDGAVMDMTHFRPTSPDMPAHGIALSDSIREWVSHHDDRVAVASYIDERAVRFGGQVLRFDSLLIDTWVANDGNWKLLASQAIPLYRDTPAASLAPDTLDGYAGTYAIGADAAVTVTRDGDALFSAVNGAKPTRYLAESKDVFVAAGLPPGVARARLFFQRDPGRRVTGYISSSGLTVNRIDAAQPGAVSAAQAVSSQVLPAQQLMVRHSGDVAVATFIHERVTQYYGQVLHTRYRSTETWVKRGAHWKMLALQSRALESALPEYAPAAGDLPGYAGTYAAGAGMAAAILQKGNVLFFQMHGDPALALRAVARDYFAVPAAPRSTLLFQRDDSGRIVGYVDRREGRDLLFVKIDARHAVQPVGRRPSAT